MRPRVFPAEDDSRGLSDPWRGHASMRPRVFPAEDCRPWRIARASGTRCFNEAAGIPRGRHDDGNMGGSGPGTLQ